MFSCRYSITTRLNSVQFNCNLNSHKTLILQRCQEKYDIFHFTSVKGNVWQSLMRISTPIHFPSNIRRLFGWTVVGICLAVGLSVTRGAHQKHLAKHFFTKPCGLVRSRYVALTNGELKKAATETATATAAGTSLNKRFNDQNNSYARAL